MKTQINGYDIEGTLEEIRELLGLEPKKEVKEVPLDNYTNEERELPELPAEKRLHQNKNWTTSETISLVQMFRDGFRTPYIAKTLGRTEASVSNRLSRIRNGHIKVEG